MTVGIMPESDRKGRAFCQFWLQGGKHNVTPTDKNPSESPWGPPDRPPPPFLEGILFYFCLYRYVPVFCGLAGIML